MDLNKLRWESVDLIFLTQNKDQGGLMWIQEQNFRLHKMWDIYLKLLSYPQRLSSMELFNVNYMYMARMQITHQDFWKQVAW